MAEVEVTLPPVKINIDENGIDFKTLEEKIYKYVIDLGKTICQEVLKELDNVIFAKMEKRKGKSEGLREKRLQTMFGSISYSRRVYEEEGKEGKTYRYYLDERLGLEKGQKLSLLYLAESLKKATEVSYRKTQSEMKKISGNEKSHEMYRQYVKRVSDKIEDLLPLPEIKDTDQKDEDKDKVTYFEADDTGLPLRDKEGKKERGSIKLGIFHRGINSRYKDTEKYYAAVNKYYIGGICNTDDFYEKVNNMIERKDLSGKEIIIGGDGADWIKKGTEYLLGYFEKTIYHLSRFHLNRNIKRALGFKKEIEKRLREILLDYDIEKVKKYLDEVIKTVKRDKKKKVEELKGYITNNWEGIISKKEIKEKYGDIRFSGIIEGNIDKVIANRFKKRGCIWSKEGANSLFTVKLSYLNGELYQRLGITRQEDMVEETHKERYDVVEYDGIKGKGEYYLRGEIPAIYIEPSKPYVKVLKQLISLQEII